MQRVHMVVHHYPHARDQRTVSRGALWESLRVFINGTITLQTWFKSVCQEFEAIVTLASRDSAWKIKMAIK